MIWPLPTMSQSLVLVKQRLTRWQLGWNKGVVATYRRAILLQGATLELRQSDGELEVRASQVRSVRLVECDTFNSAGNTYIISHHTSHFTPSWNVKICRRGAAWFAGWSCSGNPGVCGSHSAQESQEIQTSHSHSHSHHRPHTDTNNARLSQN